MTPDAWDKCCEPRRMLKFLRESGRASGRKLRLLACACCRSLGASLPESCRRGVEAAERFADGLLGRRELEAARLELLARDRQRSGRLEDAFDPDGLFPPELLWAARQAALLVAEADLSEPATALRAAIHAAEARRADSTRAGAGPSGGCTDKGRLVREFFAHPSRPLVLGPSCLTRDVLSLAHASYTERLLPSGQLDRSRLLVLADALLDAGCTDAALLQHLRSEAQHWRGCWAVDLLTGRG
jgi:hypothetical protein